MRIVALEEEDIWYQIAMQDVETMRMELHPLRFSSLPKALMCKIALEQNEDGIECDIYQIKRINGSA